jgi:hypothetical protein
MKSKNHIVGIIGMIFFLSFASAIDITAGNDYTFSVGTTEKLYWDVVGNFSNLEGLTTTQEIYSDYSNITISVDYTFSPDNFTLVFFDIKTNEVIVQVQSGGQSHGGGGNSGSRTITKEVVKYVEIDNYIDRVVEGDEIIIEKEVFRDVQLTKEEKRNMLVKGIITFTVTVGLLYFVVRWCGVKK